MQVPSKLHIRNFINFLGRRTKEEKEDHRYYYYYYLEISSYCIHVILLFLYCKYFISNGFLLTMNILFIVVYCIRIYVLIPVHSLCTVWRLGSVAKNSIRNLY